MYIKNNLKYIKNKQSSSRFRLAKELDVNESLLRKIENGTTENPQINTIKKICKYFEVNIDDFVNKDLEVLDIKRKKVDNHNSTNK